VGLVGRLVLGEAQIVVGPEQVEVAVAAQLFGERECRCLDDLFVASLVGFPERLGVVGFKLSVEGQGICSR